LCERDTVHFPSPLPQLPQNISFSLFTPPQGCLKPPPLGYQIACTSRLRLPNICVPYSFETFAFPFSLLQSKRGPLHFLAKVRLPLPRQSRPLPQRSSLSVQVNEPLFLPSPVNMMSARLFFFPSHSFSFSQRELCSLLASSHVFPMLGRCSSPDGRFSACRPSMIFSHFPRCFPDGRDDSDPQKFEERPFYAPLLLRFPPHDASEPSSPSSKRCSRNSPLLSPRWHLSSQCRIPPTPPSILTTPCLFSASCKPFSVPSGTTLAFRFMRYFTLFQTNSPDSPPPRASPFRNYHPPPPTPPPSRLEDFLLHLTLSTRYIWNFSEGSIILQMR